MPYVESPSASASASPIPEKKARKLVLCFDGTGNAFQGNTSDTNVVKIYDKLNRDDDNQFHYYQPGIGTYDIYGGSVNKGIFGKITSKISRAVDSGIATSFDAHVMAGYKFIMNYYEPGAKIYMFGFSRGAFTARFLSRMINTVGLLSRGNDEMIPFAYTLYQEYEQAKEDIEFDKFGPQSHETDETTPLLDDAQNKMCKLNNFTHTFCRRDKIFHPGDTEVCYAPVKVYFLGIFDCVSSVAVLETPFGKTPKPVSVVGTAEHVRHAVAVDEFRVKFKAALLNQDRTHEKYGKDEDVKEVWFPGNHGDVGGGWPAHGLEKGKEQRSWLENFNASLKSCFRRDKDTKATKDASKDPYQMSDIPLSWMIRELELIGAKDEAYALQWNKRLHGFKTKFNEEEAHKAPCHDTMSFGGGCNWFQVLMWNFMDYIPLFPRYELQSSGQWKMQTWPPNMASARDIPESALLHASLLHRIKDTTMERRYMPKNNHGHGEPCLIAEKFTKIDVTEATHDHNVDHTLYALNQDTVDKYKREAARIAEIKEKNKKAHDHTAPVTRSSATNGANSNKAPPVGVSSHGLFN